jgi:hypothetical protein
MPIDPSIALSFKPAQFADPLEAQARRQQIQSNALVMRSQQSALERQNMLSQRFAQGGDFSSPEFISDIMKIDPDKGMQLQQFGVQMGRDKAATAASEAEVSDREAKREETKLVKTSLSFMYALGSDASDASLATTAKALKDAGIPDDQINAVIGPVMALPPEKRKAAINAQLMGNEQGRAALAIAAPKVDKIDVGNKIVLRDMNTLSPTYGEDFGELKKGLTPGEAAQQVQNANRLAFDRARAVVEDQFKERELDQKGGDFLSKLSKAEQKDYRGLLATDKTIDAALERVGKHTTAFGFDKGAATSIGGVTGGRMGSSIVSSRMTDDEIQARSFVYNIVSAAVKERAGTAQSAQELKVLDGFLPSSFDDSRVIKAKLNAFKQYINTKRESYEPADDAGSAPASAAGPAASAPPAEAIASLRRSPGTAKQFDEIFGAGAAAKALRK